MTVAEEVALLNNDCSIVSLDVEDSPSAELPLTELYDMVTSSLLDNYRNRTVIHKTVIQILKDTMWINVNIRMKAFNSSTFGLFDILCEGGLIVSLRTVGLQ